MAFWSTKAAISLKRVKIQKKLLWQAYRNSLSLFWTVSSPTPYGLPFPKIGVPTPTKTPIAILSQERVKLRTSNLATTITGSIRSKAHWTVHIHIFVYKRLTKRNEIHGKQKLRLRNMNTIINFGEKEAWAYTGTAHFSGTPYYLRNGESYGFQIWPVHSEGTSEQKSIKNFREKGAWAYPRTAHIFGVPTIISGTGKATDFKFGQYIQRVHPNKSPWKPLEKRKRGCIQGLPKFFGYPLLFQERLKLWCSNFARTFIGSIGTKGH